MFLRSLMNISAELVENTLIVKKPKDVGRLFTKSHFGKTLPGNILQLDLLEGIFLLGEGKITVFHKKKKVDFQQLFKRATKEIPAFEIKYLIFKDLRKRGHHVQLFKGEMNTHFIIDNKKEQHFVTAFSERDVLNIDETRHLIQNVKKKKGELWFAIVDEEGDLTYYTVDLIIPKGNIREHKFSKGTGILLKNRIVLFDEKLAKNLHEKEFFGKPLGQGLQLSLVEAAYLSERKTLNIQINADKKLSHGDFLKHISTLQPDIQKRLTVFNDLKKRGLLVKTGFKFGSHFRAYTKHQDETHAEYLIHVVEKGFKSAWAEISRAVRLAHSVNKEILFARVDGKNIDYIKFGRLRP